MSERSISRRRSVLLAAAAFAAARPAAARSPAEGPLAIELFTSQGCSSCPPADALLGKLARRSDIVALSFHVTYWDYIGWKDPFASPEATARQREYARALKQRYVYTPEMVVDGIGHNAGVERGPIDALLAKARRRLAQRATPDLSRDRDGALTIRLASYKLEATADVTLAVYDRRHSTPVPRGENSGRMLENFNVVRLIEDIGRWNGTEASWTVPPDRFRPGQGMAVLVQERGCGPMLGCNKLEPMITG